jgi:two-component system osmolarity sensor histidine kinase EnvZ
MDDERTLMLAGVAHDLRTPLTNIGLAIELLRIEKNSALIDSVRRNIKDMDVLIAQFLDFARAGTLETANGVDLNQLVRECAEGHAAWGRPLKLSLQTLPQTQLRPQSIRRAIDNLVVNALRHGAEDVLIETRHLNGMVRVSVMDRGPGIPASEVEMVKVPFARGHNSTQVRGTGLGLAIVEGIVRAHGGKFVLAARDGGGLEAQIHLPLPDDVARLID